MDIAVIGQGNTGQYVNEVAESRGHNVVETFDIDHLLTEAEDLTDVSCIDFSVAPAVLDHARFCTEHNNNLIIGTTGWYDELDTVQSLVEKSGIGCLYAPNFALGVNLFFRAVEATAKLYGTGNYDVAIHEEHHTKKADAPSGTALELGKIVLKYFEGKNDLLMGNPDGKIDPDKLQISSTRLGDIFGNHQVTFEGQYDTIRMTHSIKSRRILAEGAVIAAEWLQGKQGLYTIHDLIDSMLQKG